MNSPKKRGRPPKSTTIQRQQIKAMLEDPPSHVRSLSASGLAEIKASLEHNEKIRQEILATYKHGKWTPDKHAYDMASLGDESMEGFEKKILDNDDKYRIRAQRIRDKAGNTNKNKASVRAEDVLNRNNVLIAKIGTSSAYNTHRVAKMIMEQWSSVSPAQRLVDEPDELLKRGDENPPPSLRTIERWLS